MSKSHFIYSFMFLGYEEIVKILNESDKNINADGDSLLIFAAATMGNTYQIIII